ncbi:MAG: signal peptidase I [Spirochaetia bacterium]|jgi:signal peptidase I|nr:signal peptidase I [Spirochaetia bacterium]
MKRVQSFEESRRRRSLLFKLLKYVAILFLLFELFTAFAYKSLIVGSSSMKPTISPGDRVIVATSAYGVLNPFTGRRAVFKAPQRGDMVLMNLPSSKARSWHHRFLDSVFRFVTFQRLGAPGYGSAHKDVPVIKRVVAGPGDTVMMEGFIVYVKAVGSAHFLTEYELSGGDYDIVGGQLVEGWTKDMPLAGSMNALDLGPDEFFVVGDNRYASSDSRFYGSVLSSELIGRIVLRYWPLDRMMKL